MMIPPEYEYDKDGNMYTKCYMCATSYEVELGLASDGIVLYPSIEDIKKYSPCVEQCGIVAVRVYFDKVVQEPNEDY